MIKVGIIGGAGYTGGELIRILNGHPQASISFVQSKSQAGKHLSAVHADQFASELVFSGKHYTNVDIIFLCGGHGNSRIFLNNNAVPDTIGVIDLSSDFRTDNAFSYGLPEANKAEYTNRIANPGCFATAIQLALLPLANQQLLFNSAQVHAITGSTGAGHALRDTTHFSWRESNVSVYKPFVHQHLDEIKMTLEGRQQSQVKINMIPMRGPFTRGIFASIYTNTDVSQEEALEMYEEFYRHEPFTSCVSGTVDLKRVVNTNHCLIGIEKIGGKLLFTSVIDNLVKGASGQAVQNMNLLSGIDEMTGLNLKGSNF